MPTIRDRSVVRSSVIPSAKYCWSGSLLRLANGSTTIDRCGATKGCEIDVAAGATAAGGVEEDLVAGQPHQATAAMTSAPAVAMAARTVVRRRGDTIGTLDAGRSATASGRSAYTHTGRAMF